MQYINVQQEFTVIVQQHFNCFLKIIDPKGNLFILHYLYYSVSIMS